MSTFLRMVTLFTHTPGGMANSVRRDSPANTHYGSVIRGDSVVVMTRAQVSQRHPAIVSA